MDKKKNRADPLAAGRQKLQQFRQKKADKNTDHKKDHKGSTSQGKSSKKSGKSEKHEPKPDTSAVSEEAQAPSDVAAGGAISHVNIGEEVVDPPQTSVNAAAHRDVSVDASLSELATPGNTTSTSDSGAELRKEVANSENDITISLSTEEENLKSIDIGSAGTVDSLSDAAGTEKGVTHDDASISVYGISATSENLAEGQGVEVESGSGKVEMQHPPSSLPESIPDASLICARGDQVNDEDDGSHKEQFSELSAKPDVDSIANEERQKSFSAIVDSSVSPSHFSEGSSVAFGSAELEGKTSEFRGQHIGEAAELNEEKPEASIDFRNNRDHVLSTEPKESSIADVASQLQMPESVSISGVLSHEKPCKKDTLNPSGEVSAALVDEGRSVSFLQLMDMIQGLGQDEFQVLCNAREAASSTGPGTTSLERLREELFVSSTMEDILHVQLTEQSHLQNEFCHQHNQLEAERSQLRASYNAVKERNDSLVEELSECQSNLHAATSSNEKLKNQLLATEAQVENFTSKMNELQLSLEKSLLDLCEANEKFINLHVENDTLVAIISSLNDEKKELLEEKESKNYEIKHLSSELCNCKNSAAILKAEVERLEQAVGPLTDEKINLVEEKYNLLGEAEKLKEELANCKTSVTLQEVEHSNIMETLSLLKGQQTKLKEHNLHLTEENEKAHLEVSAYLISETYLLSEYSNLKEGYSLLNNKLLKFQEEKERLVEDNDKLTHELFILQERMSPVQEERIRLAAELDEAMARLDKLAEESTSLSSSIQVEKAGIVEISNEDASELINQEIPETSGRRLEVGVKSKQSVPFVEYTCESPGTQKTTSEEAMDASSGFSSLNENLEKGEKMIQNLQEAIKQILTDSSLRKSSNKADTPAVSKLIQAFESKGQQEEHESEKGQLTGDQSDVFVSVNVQISNLRGLLEQLVLNARKAGIQFNELKDDRTATNQRLEELNVEFASHQDHINLLEADTIENKISFEVLKNCSCELQRKNHELELLCESLKLRNDSIGLKNTELNKKLGSCLSRIYELEIQLESLQNNLSSMLSSMEEQLVGLQDESLKAMMLEQELTSPISQFSEEVVRLDDCLLRYGTAGAIGVDKHMSNSVDMAVKVIDDLEEKLEVANAKHESSSNKYEELKHSFKTLLEKNGKFYADLTKLITESCGSVEMAIFKGENLVVSDPFNDGNCENLMEAVRNILSERLELQSMINQLQSDLLSKTNDMEGLTQRSLDPTSLRDLVEKVEGVLELESGEISFESPALYVAFLISQLVQKFIEAEDLANLIRKQLEAKENELMEIQESLLHHKTEMDGLRENISQAEESLVAIRSELQEKSNELEQSEQRLLSTREKLSIAVAKGKGLIVNRDNLKQSLAQTSAELQRCSEELSLKDTRLQEVEAKLKTYTEAGERVEALESELSYIRNSATALRESFLLKDSLLHRIEEILEDLDLPEQFHSRDILDKVEWLARSANGNSLRPSDWDQRGSDGGAGYVPSEPWREDGQTGTSSEDDLRIKFDELQGKFYGLAEQNEMLEQSLMHRNNLVQRWEELLGNIDMPPQLKSMEVENKIEWVASSISEARHDKDTLQRKIDNLEVYCQSLRADLEVTQKQVCDVEANLRSVDSERMNLSDRLETLNGDHDNLSARAIHLEVENEKLQNQVKDLHEKLVEKLGNEEQFQTIKGDLLSLRYMINDVIEEDGLQDLALASNSENLDVLLRKLIDYYKNLVKSSMPRERDDSFCETRPSNADVRSGESLGTHEATSHGHHPENIVEATSRDITVVESPDVASLTKDLDEALHVQKLVREERDLYMEKQQSLVAENEALDKKITELQEFLKQEEQKSASAREKLNVAVRKGKALVQQRDSLKQTIEEMNAEHGRLKSEIINRDEMLLENENKFRELESYTVRVEALESECQLLKNHLQETENILQERSDTLSMTLNALNDINIGDEGDRYDPILKLQRISQLFQTMSTAVSSAEQESIKSRRAAELLLAELNEVQERNDSMQEELSKLAYEIQQLSEQRDVAEAAKVEAISRCENLSMVNNEEKKKLYSQVLSAGTNVNTLRKILAGTNSCLADIFTMNMEFLHHLKSNMESCAKQIHKQTKEALLILCEKQGETLMNPSPEAMRGECEALEKWQKLADIEEEVYKQKSKMHWLEVGDRNNKFFHNAAKIREVRNAIREVLCPDGSIATTDEDIKKEAERFFTELLTHKPLGYELPNVENLQDLLQFRCSVEDQENLIRDITAEEVKAVVFKMQSNKSPGPDGYTTEFFKTAWPVIGNDVVVAVQSFFIKGFLPKGINSTIFALIPKKDIAKEMKDYRPISCCNVLYKVISKLLANRLKDIMPKFISANQSAFVKDRLLMENLLLATELVKDYHKSEISPRCAMKIDISKAFDSVQWPFLLATLEALGFPAKYIHWINLCVSTASFSVQVNGELAGYFNSARGLRQGCALSPSLFVICMNVLSKLLDKAAADRVVGYHPRCKNVLLTHLCFADDIIVFTDGQKRSVEGILQVFEVFEKLSGLKISLEKSTLYMAGISNDNQNAILENFPFEAGQLPVRYLGLPLLTKKMTVADYLPLMEKVRTKMCNWNGRFLSYAGRLQLIKSVIMSLTNFWLSAFRLPRQCLSGIEKLCAAFLWSGPELNTRKSKVGWLEVCRKKEEGGLGLRVLREVNEVSCLKLVWRILSGQNSIWAKWVQQYLIKKGSFWSIKESTTVGSWMWKKILKTRDTARRFHRMVVKNGETTSFWYDHWCSMGRLRDLLGERGYVDLGIQENSTVSEVIQNHRKRRHRVVILNKVEEEIDKLKAENQHAEDIAVWRNKAEIYKPMFSSNNTWLLTRKEYILQRWSKCIWFKHATPKYAFHIWTAMLDRLSTCDRMMRWNPAIDPICVLCKQDVETRNHLFFCCEYSSQIWGKLMRGLLHTGYTERWEDIVELMLEQRQDRVKVFLIRYTFQAAAHSIWRERNCRRHGEKPLPHVLLAKIIDKNVRNRLSSIRRQGDQKMEKGLRMWFGTR